jgi:RNase P subunit RPR2
MERDINGNVICSCGNSRWKTERKHPEHVVECRKCGNTRKYNDDTKNGKARR